MKHFEPLDYKYDLLSHFLDGGGHDIRVNPIYSNGEQECTEEEEMLRTMYVMEQLPYLEVYYSKQRQESMIRIVRDVDKQDAADYFYVELNFLRLEHNNMIENIKRILYI